MTPSLRMSGVVKRYGRRRALDGLDLEIPPGAVVGLVGSNGAGKTTALGVAAGFARPDSGTVDLFGEGPFDPERHRGRLSVLPQDSDPPPYAVVGPLLRFYGRLQGLSPERAREEAQHHLEWVHLADRADAPLRTLSHGMKRRVAIAQAFLGDPELVLLDEPLSGLDPREVAGIRDLLAKRRERAAIVISSHNLHEIELVCDRVAFIERGRTVRSDTLREVVGHGRELTCLLGEGRPPLERLRRRLTDRAVVEWDEAARRLTCRFDETRLAYPAAVRAVVEELLAEETEILEIRRGGRLENVFLRGVT